MKKNNFLILLISLALFSCGKESEECLLVSKNQVSLKGEIVNPDMKFCGNSVSIDPTTSSVNKQITDLLNNDDNVLVMDNTRGIIRIDENLDYLSSKCSDDNLDIVVDFLSKSSTGEYVEIVNISNNKNKFEILVNQPLEIDKMSIEVNSLDKVYLIEFTDTNNKRLYFPIDCNKNYIESISANFASMNFLYGTEDYNVVPTFKGTIKGGYIEDFK